jgi:hypothetical protein
MKRKKAMVKRINTRMKMMALLLVVGMFAIALVGATSYLFLLIL